MWKIALTGENVRVKSNREVENPNCIDLAPPEPSAMRKIATEKWKNKIKRNLATSAANHVFLKLSSLELTIPKESPCSAKSSASEAVRVISERASSCR